jgi:osmotically-inducible protein OsmY
MKLFLTLIIFHLILSGCSTIATGGAEVTGLSLLHDRRTSKSILVDERIEINSSYKLNTQKDTRSKCHFNVTSYNQTVLVTGEAPTEELRNKIISIVRTVPGVKLVHNELKIANPSSLATRTHDTLITTAVKSSISKINNLPGFDATRIKVITESKVVYLLGLVHKKEAQAATEVARREADVSQVVQIFEYID